ncbi:hypothetical protein CPB83DRAFT_851572 [Crepidotus variabilis]|uniref:Uncharacterized protein n=1 Tax=Crepidotus variabilis TaxID=179855 RepID=A0A9P6JRA9_9AGAR|nr:hypothetical protein CPB83DRAFT_851572 [Crepidotus variabilis]
MSSSAPTATTPTVTSPVPESASESVTSQATPTSNAFSDTFKIFSQPYILIIIAFIALLIAWKILMLRRRRRLALEAGGLFELRQLSGRWQLPPRPILWDLWTESYVKWSDISREGDAKDLSVWSNFIPLSATVLPPPEPPQRSHSPRSTKLILGRSIKIPRLSKNQDTETSATSAPSTTRLQVEVTIAMPSKQYPLYPRWRRKEEKKQTEEFRHDMEFCVGVRTVEYDL